MLIFLNNPCGSSVSWSTIAKDDVFFRCMSKRNGATSSGIEGTPYKPVNEVTMNSECVPLASGKQRTVLGVENGASKASEAARDQTILMTEFEIPISCRKYLTHVGNLDRCRGRIERQALVFSCVSRQLFARLQLSFGHFHFVAGVACFVAAIPFAVALHDSCRRRYVRGSFVLKQKM